MTKHTPAPWEVRKNPHHKRRYDIYSEGRHIAYVGPGHTSPEDYPEGCAIMDEANADLIAAAPDMLAALERLMQVIERSYGIVNYYDDGGTEAWDEMEEVKAIKAAIAKAKGE